MNDTVDLFASAHEGDPDIRATDKLVQLYGRGSLSIVESSNQSEPSAAWRNSREDVKRNHTSGSSGL